MKYTEQSNGLAVYFPNYNEKSFVFLLHCGMCYN